MQTFKQFVEAREIRDIPQNNIKEILRHIKDKRLIVKFALYCVEDCFHFNDEQTRPLAQRCIDLVKKWLRDPKSVTEQELLNAAQYTNVNYTGPRNALQSAQSICSAIPRINEPPFAYFFNNVIYASASAYASGHQYDTPEWNQIYNQKLQEYIRKLKGMTTTRSGHSTSIEPLKGYDNDYVTIMAALDSLEEIGEIGKDHFVYQDDEGQWVFDLGHDNILRAASKEALAKEINKDRYYLNALLRLYNANV